MINILVIGTGGTIAGLSNNGEESNYRSGVIGVEKLTSDLHNNDDYVNLNTFDLFNLNSDDITIDEMYDIASKVKDIELEASYDGVIITHGTDTLEETAFFLSLFDFNIPVVITGAMLPYDAPYGDGRSNLADAVNSIISLHNSDMRSEYSVYVQFAGKLMDAMNVIKVHSSRKDAFSLSEKDIRDDLICICNRKADFSLIRKDSLHNTKVPVLYFYTDADDNIVDYYLSKEVKGFVIAGAGAGEYSKRFIDKTKMLASLKIPVIRTTKIKNGPVNTNQDLDKYVINGGYITPEKAAIFLRVHISLGNM